MTIRLSSGLCSAMITSYGLGAMMQYGHIRLFTGSQPASANNAQTGTLVAVITDGGVSPPAPGDTAGGLLFEAGDIPGTLAGRGTWMMKGVAAGVPGWWRFVWNSEDTGADSMEMPRIDGAIGESVSMPPGMTAVTALTNAYVPRFAITMPSEVSP